MTDNPDTRPHEGAVIPVGDTPHAPHSFFYEGAPAFGFTNGVVNVTLAANRTWVGPDGKIVNDQVVSQHICAANICRRS